MFGYIKLDNYSPKIYKDYFTRNYCFLCRALDKHYGLFSRLFVSFDVTFFTILFSEDNYLNEMGRVHCFKSNKELKERLKDEYAKKVAALDLALAAGELEDNIGDKDKFYAKPVYNIYKRTFNKVKKDYPLLWDIVEKGHKEMDNIEKVNGSLEEIENAFANFIDKITRDFFNITDESKISIIKYIAKMLYYMDAVDDIDKDIKRNSYNALKVFSSKKDYILSNYSHIKTHMNYLKNEVVLSNSNTINNRTIRRIVEIGIPEKLLTICLRGVKL